MATVTSANKQNIFIPDGVWDNIFSYFHSSYRKPLHVDAIKKAHSDENHIFDLNEIYVLDLNIWYDDRTGYVHEHDERYPIDERHQLQILLQEQNKTNLLDQLEQLWGLTALTAYLV